VTSWLLAIAGLPGPPRRSIAAIRIAGRKRVLARHTIDLEIGKLAQLLRGNDVLTISARI